MSTISFLADRIASSSDTFPFCELTEASLLRLLPKGDGLPTESWREEGVSADLSGEKGSGEER